MRVCLYLPSRATRIEAMYNTRMKVLGIDPGFGRCGMAILERIDGKDALAASQCVETSPQAQFPDRLADIVAACTRLLEAHRPDALAIEKLFFKANRTTAMRVAEVRGALMSCAVAARVPVFEYTPAEVKSAVSGFGKADKKQVATMLHMLLKIDKRIARDDEYDAIAIALTHLAHARMASTVVESGKSR